MQIFGQADRRGVLGLTLPALNGEVLRDLARVGKKKECSASAAACRHTIAAFLVAPPGMARARRGFTAVIDEHGKLLASIPDGTDRAGRQC
jgi:hypothetical protein